MLSCRVAAFALRRFSVASTSGEAAALGGESGEELPFATQLRHSKLMQAGDLRGPDGKGTHVLGTINQVMEDDLYIDFGAKFRAVCKRPRLHSEHYVLGAFVKLAVRDSELSGRFLGSGKDLSLLEADATLLGLLQDPKTETPE